MTTETHAGQVATGAEGSRAAPASAALWLAVAALVVALAAAGAAAVAFYQAAVTARLETGEQRGLVERLASEQDGVVERQGQVAARVDDIGARLDDLERSLTSALDQESSRRESALADFRAEFDALAGSVEQVYEDLGRSVDTWVLEEVEQLLLLANQRLTLAADTGLAIAALEIADAKLGDIGDPALLPVRRQLAEELAALDRVPELDVDGAALRLGALMNNVGDLPLAQDMERPEWQTGEAAGGAGDKANADAGGVERLAREMLADLGRLVRVRRVDETRAPRLTTVQRFLVDENLRLMLASARQALLDGRAAVYRQDLEAAREWMARYIAMDSDVAVKFGDELEALAALPVQRELPPIDGSLALLRELIAERGGR